MRKKNEKSKICITTPWWIYLSSATLAIIFLVFSLFLIKSDCGPQGDAWWGNLFLNVGYGTIASVVVTFLVDIGNTKRQQIQDKKEFDRLNAELKELCAELPSEMYIAVYESFGYTNNEKRTFEQWTKTLFVDGAIDNGVHEREIKNITQHIFEIKKAIAQLKRDSRIFGNNPYVNDEYEKKLNKLRSCASIVIRNSNEYNYTVCSQKIAQQLKDSIIELYDDLTVDYTRIYNEEDYE